MAAPLDTRSPLPHLQNLTSSSELACGVKWVFLFFTNSLFVLYSTMLAVTQSVQRSVVGRSRIMNWTEYGMRHSWPILNYFPGIWLRELRTITKASVRHTPTVWSSCQSSWLQIQRSRVRFSTLLDFLRISGSGTGSTQPHEYNWEDTWKKKERLRSRKSRIRP
jgi:hypothetical protein